MVRFLKSLSLVTLLFTGIANAQLDAIELENFDLAPDSQFETFNASLNGTPASADGETVQSVVSLEVESTDGSGSWGCTGFIVSKDLIMTSGHCLTGKLKPIKIKFGVGGYRGFTHTLYSSTYEYVYANEFAASGSGSSSWVNGYLAYSKKAREEFERELAQRKKWAYYNQENFNMVDFGLIKISQIPAGYGPAEFLQGQVRFRQTAVNVGYGINSRNQSENDGRLRWGLMQFTGFEVDEKYHITGFQLFSKDDNDQSICMGDSGGPLFVRVDGKLKVVGINTVVINKCAGAAWITNPRYYRNQLKNMAKKLRATLDI